MFARLGFTILVLKKDLVVAARRKEGCCAGLWGAGEDLVQVRIKNALESYTRGLEIKVLRGRQATLKEFESQLYSQISRK